MQPTDPNNSPKKDDNPYGFIFEQQKQKQPMLVASTSKTGRLLVFVVGIAIAVVVAVAGFQFITSIGQANNDDLKLVRAEQQELERVLELGLKNASDTNLRNRLKTLQASTSSDRQQVDSLLKKRKVVVQPIELNAAKDSSVDKKLEEALVDGSHDQVLLEQIEKRTNSYYQKLKAAQLDSATQSETDLLKNAVKNLETIVTE